MAVNGGEVFRVSCRFKTTTAGDIVNVYHIRLLTGTAVADADFVSDVEAWLSTVYANITSTVNANTDPYDLRIDQVEISGGVESVVRNVITKTWTLTTPPAGAGDELPQTDAAIVNFRTVYPRVFGRKYIGTVGEGSQSAGTLIAGAVTALGNYAASVIAAYTGTYVNFSAGVLSLKVDPLLAYFAPFVGYVVNSIMGNQRRRRVNRGS